MPLETEFGKLTLIGGGYHSRVYANQRRQVIKVYKQNIGLHLLEAANMRQAGLGDWVIATLVVGGQEALVMQHFDGAPVTAQTVQTALPALGVFLRSMHTAKQEAVNLEALHQRLERFRSSLNSYPELTPFLARVDQALKSHVLETSRSFCHLDLWSDNILFAAPDQVRVVDWHKAAWDDAARDYAILFTGTLELLPVAQATAAILELAKLENGVLERLPAYIALTTLHDLYWFLEKQPENFLAAFALKVPRVTWFLEQV